MKKVLIVFGILLAMSSITRAQQQKLIFQSDENDEKQMQVLILEDGINTEKIIDIIDAPKDIKSAILKDVEENYVEGEDYYFTTHGKDKTYSLEITDNLSADNIIIDDDLPFNLYPENSYDNLIWTEQRAYLGLKYGPFKFKEDSRKELRGVVVEEVVDGEAAYNAGLEVGDVITKINGVETPSKSLFLDAIKEIKPRDEVVFTINRKGKELVLKSVAGATTGTNNDLPQSFNFNRGGNMHPYFFKGIDDLEGKLLELDDENFESLLKSKPMLGITIEDDEEGVSIKTVNEESAAAEAGLMKGDTIIALDNQTVTNSKELIELVQSKEIGDEVKITYLRKGKKKKTDAKLKEGKQVMYFFK